MFSFKEIIGDVRNAFVALLIAGGVSLLTPIVIAMWKWVQQQPVPWTVLIAIGLCGFVLIIIALVVPRGRTKKSVRDPGRAPILVIHFDHLPRNMLECGWVRAYPQD